MEKRTEINYSGSDDTYYVSFPRSEVKDTVFEEPCTVELVGELHNDTIEILIRPETEETTDDATTRRIGYKGSNTYELVLTIPIEIIQSFSIQNAPVNYTITNDEITLSITPPPDSKIPSEQTISSEQTKTSQYSSGHYILRIPTEVIGTYNAVEHVNKTGDSSPKTYTGDEYNDKINTRNNTVAIQFTIDSNRLHCIVHTNTENAPFHSREVTINPKFAYRKAGEIAVCIPRPIGSMFNLDRIPFEWSQNDDVLYGKSVLQLD